MRAEAATEVTGRWEFSAEATPTFLVCTPRYLASFVRGPIINEEALFESIRYLVLDEVYDVARPVMLWRFRHILFIFTSVPQADMLLDGSYVRDVETVMDALKVVRRALIREGLVQVSVPPCWSLAGLAVLTSAVHTLARSCPGARAGYSVRARRGHHSLRGSKIRTSFNSKEVSKGEERRLVICIPTRLLCLLCSCHVTHAV